MDHIRSRLSSKENEAGPAETMIGFLFIFFCNLHSNKQKITLMQSKIDKAFSVFCQKHSDAINYFPFTVNFHTILL